jgi:hypothetical protein
LLPDEVLSLTIVATREFYTFGGTQGVIHLTARV